MLDPATAPTAAPCAETDAAELFERLYAELRALARRRRVRSEVTIEQTTALMHDAYLRMHGAPSPSFDDPRRFLAYASATMRSIVVDRVRQRHTAARDVGRLQTLDTDIAESVADRLDRRTLAVHDALSDLQRLDPRLAQVVELRYFAGLDDDEIAAATGSSVRTVQRDWHKARLLLRRAIGDG